MNLVWVLNRFSHRPSNIFFDVLELKRAIYRINLLKTIETTDIMINIDECTISRNTHPKYSWSQKWKRAEMKSIVFDKSVSIISGISSDGWSFSHLHTTTIDSSNFTEFLVDLKKYIQAKWHINGWRIVIILDNASSHKANRSVQFMKANFGAIFFLPQYTPQYAPVENFFSVLKNNLWSKLKGKYQSSQSSTTMKSIETTIKAIGCEQIIHMWDHNFQLIQEENRLFVQMNKKSCLY